MYVTGKSGWLCYKISDREIRGLACFITYREIIRPDSVHNLFCRILAGKSISKSMLNYYTRSIVRPVGKIYGLCYKGEMSMKKERIFLVFEYGERTDVLVGCYRNEEDAKRKHAEHPTFRYIEACKLE